MKETPSQLPIQSYVMNFPHTFSTDNPNNVWMEEMSNKELSINKPKAYKQFMDLYNFMAGQSLRIKIIFYYLIIHHLQGKVKNL